MQTIYNQIKQTSGFQRAGMGAKEGTGEEWPKWEELWKNNRKLWDGGGGVMNVFIILIAVMLS